MNLHRLRLTASACVCCAVASPAWSSGVPGQQDWLEEIVVRGSLDALAGQSWSASVGTVTSEQLDLRPVLRTGELLEVVPGLIVTQHSGSGKANQYFLRGFNLDHGTDLATSVDGVPVNMPTHAHGQGYTDVSFVIPELVQSIDYRKGVYYAETGNFSAAGAVNLRYRDRIEAPFVQLDGGENGLRRAVVAASPDLGSGALLFGAEYAESDGPWALEENLRRANALVRYSRSDGERRLAITAQAYDGEWDSTDQIPLRAVENGSLDRFGFVDPTDGGESHRYSIGVDWAARSGRSAWSARAYAIDYGLDLFSNFTYALEDAVNGDQFEQLDDRRIYGAAGAWTFDLAAGRFEHALTIGADARRDDIDAVGLYRTVARERTETIREDEVVQTSYSTYASVATTWSAVVRTSVGVRADYFDFDVASNLAANSGRANDSIVSPKFSLVLGPWAETEFFVNVGRGFHSNDARGATMRVDPTDGVTPVDRVDPLVAALGADVGLRTAILPRMQLTFSLWTLELDSELLFVGDAGVTEPSRASERRGVEIGAIWNPLDWLIIDADLAWSDSKFTDFDAVGDEIPGAVKNVASLGVAIDHPSGWFGGARLRHFGSAPLLEDGSVESDPTTLVNLEAGYRFGERFRLSAAVFNVFDSDDNDITYFYESRLPGEPAPVEDIHFHPVEPRTFRVTATTRF